MGCQMAFRQLLFLRAPPHLTDSDYLVVGLVVIRTNPWSDWRLIFRCRPNLRFGIIVSGRTNDGQTVAHNGLNRFL